ncbi:MAG: hypothetical protein GTO02_11645 [Candidatus Dadabacteria bacterium]|nr:hypothetical protein [Candidatus Dadabacteria bacterium]NIQ15009.1 hypothetical protein [Candidatus Dadabacteria bacterium]
MLKLGSVPFLNASPLTYPLEKRMVDHNFDLYYFDPSILSKKLKNGDIDVGLIPVAELLMHDDYVVVPDISISSIGKVDSVILQTKCDIKDLSTIAVDIRSQSSTALLKIVMELFLGLKPQYIKREVDDDFIKEVDGGMLIGDSGLRALYNHKDEYNIYDLGELWTQNTGLPFVYAVFAMKEGVDLGKNYDSLIKSKEIGKKMIPQIIESRADNLGISKDQCFVYLNYRIKYDLGTKEIEGLYKYAELLHKINEIEKEYKIKIYNN